VKARLIYNPSAGMRNTRDEIYRAIDELRAHGWSVDVAETTQVGDGMRIAQASAQEKFDALIAVGGDGTVNEVANGLVDTDTALGVLPSGTANMWAREMGLPLNDLVGAAKRLADAEIRTIDVGEVRGETIAPRIFVLWCGVGFDAAVTRGVEEQREMKRHLGSLAFIVAGVREAINFRGARTTLWAGDKRIRKRVILALACNIQMYSAFIRIAPNAKVDDGRFDLIVLKGTGVFATAWHIVKIVFGWHLRDPQTDTFRAPTIRIAANGMPVHVDAEPIGYSPIEIRMRAKALKVLVPKTANQDLFVRS
jgi:diacylglycerol kinase (ATP)